LTQVAHPHPIDVASGSVSINASSHLFFQFERLSCHFGSRLHQSEALELNPSIQRINLPKKGLPVRVAAP